MESTETFKTFRQTGGKTVGRVRRGQPLSTGRNSASIPSKFETILNVGDRSRDGFGTRTHRFIDRESETPSPGQYYEVSHSQSSVSRESTSYSKKGYGGFASVTKRWYEEPRATFNPPGPGSADAPDFIQEKANQPSNRAGVTSMFARSRSASPGSRLRRLEPTPGPGQYSPEALDGKLSWHSEVGSPAFRSKSSRLRSIPLSSVPPNVAPGSYDPHIPEENKLHFDEKLPSAVFRSRSEKCPPLITGEETPGPGHNDPKLPGEYRSPSPPGTSIGGGYRESSPSRGSPSPRLTRPPPSPSRVEQATKARLSSKPWKETPADSPGPGQYHAPKEVPKQAVSSSVFLSSTQRPDFVAHSQEKWKPPGPSMYSVESGPSKKSFHLNTPSQWN